MKRTYFIIVLLFVIRAAVFGQQASAGPLGNDPAKFDERVEAASTRHDADFFTAVLADDVRFTHGTGLVQSKQQWIDSVRKSTSQTVVRDLDSVEVEPHGDLIETIGHVHVQVKRENTVAREYHIWFVRLYSRRQDGWRLISNRTVREVNGALPAH
jgi:ketosteroid isomerase-like protein